MKTAKGFTLIELIVYIAIVSVVLVLIGGFTLNIIYGGARTAAEREVQQNARFVMDTITRTIRQGAAPAALYNVSNGVLYSGSFPLTTPQVKVANLIFTPLSGGYKINLSMEYNNPNNKSEYSAALNLESAALAR